MMAALTGSTSNDRTLSKTKWVALIVIALFLITSFPKRIVLYVAGDGLDWHSRRLIGWQAVDCGRVAIRHNPQEATNCALKADAEGRPFRVRYNIQGYDSEVAVDVVRARDNHVYMLNFVGDPMGKSGVSFFRQTTAQIACPEPIHLYVNPKGRINCFQPQLAPPCCGLLVPNFEAY